MSGHTPERDGDAMAAVVVHQALKVGDRVLVVADHCGLGGVHLGRVGTVESVERGNGDMFGDCWVAVVLDAHPDDVADYGGAFSGAFRLDEIVRVDDKPAESPADGAPATTPAPSAGTTDEPSPFCWRHQPFGPRDGGLCGPCGGARKRYQLHRAALTRDSQRSPHVDLDEASAYGSPLPLVGHLIAEAHREVALVLERDRNSGREEQGDGSSVPQELDAEPASIGDDSVRDGHERGDDGVGQVERLTPVVQLAHQDSSSVVPGAGTPGRDHTVEAGGDASRVDSSTRRVAADSTPAPSAGTTDPAHVQVFDDAMPTLVAVPAQARKIISTAGLDVDALDAELRAARTIAEAPALAALDMGDAVGACLAAWDKTFGADFSSEEFLATVEDLRAAHATWTAVTR